ncbi:ABC transporter permease [Flavobacterium sp. 17A]|uniref:ABC transporter permease n=1 Tax=Flavobacterium potami TaxID=2872310 RepID=A0A9X1KQP7_9FLAO|nr:ABC transporter permease [Flavobacterium potami]MBZ4035679.1 ABC transporter permease [Flavobacterium potami]
MKKILNTTILFLITIIGSLTFTSCNNFSPEKTFDVAVLNSNLLSRFGGKEISSKLESEAQVYDESQKKMIPSSYQDAFKYDISNLEIRLKSISEIPEDDDNKEMLQASKDLFSYVIAKQKEGYLPIAKMKDEKASPEQIQQAIADFDASTQTEVDAKFNKLMAVGKAYAEKHNIDAKFGI